VAAVTEQIPGRVHWTAKTRALIEPHTRSIAPSPAPTPDLGGAVATLKKVLAWRSDNIRQAIPGADDRCRKLTHEVLLSLDRPPEAWLQESAEVDAARAMLLDVEDRGARLPDGRGTSYFGGTDDAIDDAFLDLWCARGGLPTAVEMLAGSHAFELACRDYNGLGLDAAEKWTPRSCPAHKVWLKLRKRLITCPDAEYDACRQTAERLRTRSFLALRCSLDYAFPQESGWAAEDAARVLAGEDSGDRAGWLLACLRDPVVAKGIARASRYSATQHLYTMMDLIGAAAAPALEEWVLGSRGWAMDARRKLARQLAMIEAPGVAAFFASSLEDPGVVKAATAYFEEFPGISCVALRDATAAGRPRAAELLGLLESRPSPAGATAAASDANNEEIPPSSALPAVLAAPPWSRKGQPARKAAVVRDVVPLAVPESIVWKPGEREYHLSGRGCQFSFAYPERMHGRSHEPTKDDEARHLGYFQQALAKEAEEADLRSLFWLSDENAIATWSSFPPEKYKWYDAADLHRLLARHGLAALPGFLAFAVHRPGLAVEALARVRSPRVAALMATAHTTLVRGRRIASGWLTAFTKEAAMGLIPAAVGVPGQGRRHAEAALRFLSTQGHPATIQEVARMYGEEVQAAVAEVLAFDPYALYPRRLPELPLFWTPAHWPRPRLRSGEELPATAVDALGTMLAFSSVDDPYVGIGDVLSACDPRSLAAFAWALFQAWDKAGAPAKGEWAFHALSLLGDDETARQLAAQVEPWSKEGRHGRALTALRVLAAMDTDAALACVRTLSEKAKSRALRGEARQRLDEIAERRGLSTEQLADLLVPDLELDASGARTLDFGPRRFVVTLDEKLKPIVKDQDGKVLRDLPEPGARDDTDRASAAVAEWKVLKRQLPAVLKSETARFERAMGSRRRWDGGEFSQRVVAHPVLGWLARRLIWGAYNEANSLVATFRVAEDRTLADVGDSAWTVPDGCRVGLPYVLELEDSVRRRWTSLLADYELPQPFRQLERETFRAEAAELPTRAISVMAGQKVTARKLLGLESRGWDRVGGKNIVVLVKSMHALECEAELPLDPGLFAGDLLAGGDQTLGPVTVRRLGTWDADPLTVEEMGPALYSELVRDLMSLRS
jgi:hypothetical protein